MESREFLCGAKRPKVDERRLGMTLTELPFGACGGRGASGKVCHSIAPKTEAVVSRNWSKA